MIVVFKSLVYSHIDYGLPIWGAVSNTSLAKCKKRINHFLKCLFIQGYSFNFRYNNVVMRDARKHAEIDIDELYERLCLLTIFERYTYMTVLFTRSLLPHEDK